MRVGPYLFWAPNEEKDVQLVHCLHAVSLHGSALKKAYLHLLLVVTLNLEKGGTEGRPPDAALVQGLAKSFPLGSVTSPEGQLPHLESGTIRNLSSYLKGCCEKKGGKTRRYHAVNCKARYKSIVSIIC